MVVLKICIYEFTGLVTWRNYRFGDRDRLNRESNGNGTNDIYDLHLLTFTLPPPKKKL